MKLVDHLYFGQSQAKDMVLDLLATAPAAPVDGQIYYDTVLLHAYGRINGSWKVLDNTYTIYSDIISVSAMGVFSGGLTSNYIITYDGAGKLVGVDPNTLGSGHTHSLAGDVVGTTASTSVNKVKGTTVTVAASAINQVLFYNGTNYVPTILNIALSGDVVVASTAINNTTSLAVTVSQLRGKAFTSTQVNSNGFLKFNTSSGWSVDTNTYLTSSTGVSSIIAGTNITVSGATGNVTIGTSLTPTFTTITTTNFTLNGTALTYNATPSAANDLITFGYIQNQAFGLRDFKESVKYIVTSLSGLVYTATTVGPNGTGQITTAPSTLNATALVVGDRILIAVTGGNAANGIYIVTTVGTGVNGVWNRSTDFNSATNVSLGAYTYVEQTSAGYVLSGPSGTLVIGGASGTALQIIQFSGAGTYTAGTGLTLSGGQFSITNTTVGANSYGVSTPGATQAIPTFTVNAQGQLTAAGSFLTSTITNVGTIETGTWNATIISLAKGGTGVNNTSIAQNYVFAGPTSGTGNATFRALVLGDVSTAISTWTGSTSITTLGTITTGTWHGAVIDEVYGGTGQSVYVIGDILYASTTTVLSRLADVATGNALISGGVGVAPSWGKIGLTTHISGILPIANGGTALSTVPTNGKLLIGNGTNYTLANLTAGNGINITNGAGTITISNAVLVYEVAWNPSTTAATLITTGPHTGYYQYVVNHALNITNAGLVLVDNSTGEEYLATVFNASTLNVASPTYANANYICVRMSATGWSTISAKTNLTVRIRG